MMKPLSKDCYTTPFDDCRQRTCNGVAIAGDVLANPPKDIADVCPTLPGADMTFEQLQQLAFDIGLDPSTQYTSQTQRIRTIQLQRGVEPCFLPEKRYTCSEICEWSRECRKLMAQWKL